MSTPKKLKGLKGLAGLSQQEKDAWVKSKVEEGYLLPHSSWADKDRLYRNDQFVKKFGIEAFNKLKSVEELDYLYKEAIVNEEIQSYYGNDDNFSTIANMTTEGKIALLESGYENDSDTDDYWRREMDKAHEMVSNENFQNSLAIAFSSDQHGNVVSPGLQTSKLKNQIDQINMVRRFEKSGREARNKQLEYLIAQDNNRKLENTTGLANKYRNQWKQGIDNGTIQEGQIDKLFEEYIGNYSNHYKAFKYSEELENFTLSDKLDFLAEFMGVYDTYGAESAVGVMNTKMQDYISDQQDWWDWSVNTVSQILTKGVANLANKIMALEAITKAINDAATGDKSLDRFLSGEEYWTLFGNPLYWQGVDQYNTIDAYEINRARKNGGLSPYQNITKAGEEMEFLSWKTVNDAVGQLGYIWSEIAASQLTGLAGKGLSKVSPVFTSSLAKGLGTTIDIGQSVSGMAFSEGLSSYQETVNQANERINAQMETDAMEYVQQQASTEEFKTAVNNEVLKLEDYYSNLGVSRTKEDIISEASSLVSQKLAEQYKAAMADKYEEDRAEARNAGVKAYMTTATLFSIKEATTNTLFQRWMYNKGTRQALGDNGPKLNIVNNADGTVSASISRWNKYAKPFVSNAATEFFEEVTDNMVNNFGQGFGLNSFNNYFDKKYNPEAYVEAYDNILGSMMSGWAKTKESLTTIDPYYEGFIGAISGVGGGTVDVYRNVKRDKNLPKEVKVINDILKKHGNSMQDVVTAFNLLHDVDVAIAEGDMMGAIDAKQRQAFALVQTLNKLENSEAGRQSTFYQNTMQTLQSLADGKMKEEQLNELVTQFLGQGKNKSIADSPTAREDAVKTLTENAKELLNIKQSVDEVNAVLDKSPNRGLISPGVREELVYLKVMGQNWQKRLNSIEEAIGNSGTSTTFNADAAYGSKKSFENKKEQLQKKKESIHETIAKINTSIEEINDMPLNSKEEKQLKAASLNALKLRKKQLKKQLNKVKQQDKDMERYSNNFDDKGYSRTLTKEEILALPAAQRAEMLDPKNLSNYSPEQQLIITDTVDFLTAKDPSLIKSIEDAGVLAQRISEVDKVFSEIVNNPEDANTYMLELKKQNIFKAEELYKEKKATEKAQQLNTITDYTEFSKEMDAIFNEGSAKEQQVISKYLKEQNNSLYNKYIGEKNKVMKILNHVAESREFNELSDNDADMFINTLSYLHEQGVDLSDKNVIIKTLSEKDKDGKLEFEKYIEKVNERLSSDDKVVFTSIGEAIYNFNNVMREYLEEEGIRQDDDAPIVINPESDNGPVVIPDAVVVPTDENAVVNDEDDIHVPTEEEGVKIDTSIEEEVTFDNPLIQSFANNSGEVVARVVENLINLINKIPRYSESTRKSAIESLHTLKDRLYEKPEELLDAILTIANIKDAQSDTGTSDTASILRAVHAKVRMSLSENKPDIKKKRSNFFERKKKQLDTITQIINENYNMFPNSTTNSAFIASINIDHTRVNYPESAVVQYYEDHNIDEAILEGILNNRPRVYFITDENLTAAVKQQMSNYNSETTLPIVAVVESSKGTITIEGKKYQPIGVMASTDREGSAGSAHMGPIRSLALNNTGTQLVKTKDGKVVSTQLYTHPIAYSADVNYRGRNSVIAIGINDMLPKDKRRVENIDNAKDRRNDPSYIKARKKFLEKLSLIKKQDRTDLYYLQTSLDGGTNTIELFVAPINETLARDSNATFEELAAALDDNAIVEFNSRTIRASRVLDAFLKNFTTEGFAIYPKDEQLVASKETEGALQEIANRLGMSIGNFLNIPIGQGWNYSIELTNEIANGKPVMQLSLKNSLNTEAKSIPLLTFHQGMSAIEIAKAKATFLKNLILDENGKVRMLNEKDSFVKWNVTYTDAVDVDKKEAQSNTQDIYDDDILTAAATTFNYRIRGFAVHNPFKSDGTLNPEIANSDNADDNVLPKGQVHSGGAVVDSDTSIVIEGEVTPTVNPAHQHAQELARKIEEDSRNYELSEDGTVYIDKRTGDRYARVTSLISADEHSDGRMDANNSWVIPSTNIGTGIDTLVRDFFEGTVKHDTNGYYIADSQGNRISLEEKYPNATEYQLQTFCADLAKLQNFFNVSGITIVPRDIMAVGNIEVMDNNGDIQKIKVAGKLDLLAYDSEGNFIILDMKSHLSRNISEDKKSKWGRQLSLYKELLEARYGIDVKDLRIIPIKVAYPTSNNKNVYTVSEKKDNQLILNNKEFQNASPRLETIISLGFSKLNIVWDKLTEQERSMAQSLADARQEQHPEIETTPDAGQVEGPTEVHKDSTLGGNYVPSTTLEEQFGIEVTEESKAIEVTEKPANIPENMKWENLTEEQKEYAGMIGYNKNNWNDLTLEEIEHILDCL